MIILFAPKASDLLLERKMNGSQFALAVESANETWMLHVNASSLECAARLL